MPKLPARPRAAAGKRWQISGNEAAGYGAIRGGVRFVAAYPITPATELLEWMAPALAKVGGTLVQAEDELASVNMVDRRVVRRRAVADRHRRPRPRADGRGASGSPVSAEVPIVIVDVMRGGPSTGIPAKSEQSDLSFAVSGLHGDAPRLVLAPTSIADCLATTQWAVRARRSAAGAGDRAVRPVHGPVARDHRPARRRRPASARALTAAADTPDYKRYRNTESGVSPMAIPGTAGIVYTADGLEHTEAGIPSSQSRDHRLQLDKRERKLAQHDYGALLGRHRGRRRRSR